VETASVAPVKEEVKELSRSQKFVQALSQPLSPWEYAANALIHALVIFTFFAAGNFVIAKFKEAREKKVL
jgi:hypothetical protein